LRLLPHPADSRPCGVPDHLKLSSSIGLSES
jgi:hypothetical protein